MREVDRRVDMAMGRDPHEWRLRNICAPCLYKTDNETPLEFSVLACMDGNNSLKLVDSTFKSGTPRSDDRTSTSARWVTPDQVNRFKDEVLNSRSTIVSSHFLIDVTSSMRS
jgi:Kyakuja-Dileera-Zisupton transposase